MRRKIEESPPQGSHTHWLADQSYPQAKASQRVCLYNLEKEIFKNAPRTTEKEGQRH